MHNTDDTPLDRVAQEAFVTGEMYAGYALEEAIRSVAASGGIVSALLIDMLERGEIQGALVSRLGAKEGKIAALTTLVCDREGVLAHAGSAYVDTDVVVQVKALKKFSGKAAVVALPCQARAIRALIESDASLREKVHVIISLVCRGTVDIAFYHDFMKKHGIDESEVQRIRVARRHVEGTVFFESQATEGGREVSFFTLNAYRMAGIHAKKRCCWCVEHLGAAADIVAGDLYCREYKNRPIKHSAFAAYTDRGAGILERACHSGAIVAEYLGMETYKKIFHRIERFSNDIVSRNWAARLQGLRPLRPSQGIPSIFRCLAWGMFFINFRLSQTSPGRRLLYAFPAGIVKGMALTIKGLSRF